jgi:hypothetical protein
MKPQMLVVGLRKSIIIVGLGQGYRRLLSPFPCPPLLIIIRGCKFLSFFLSFFPPGYTDTGINVSNLRQDRTGLDCTGLYINACMVSA